MGRLVSRIGGALGRYLSRPRPAHGAAAPTDLRQLSACLRAGDVVLVEGNTRVSVAIKYLTQSTWSHAALCVGDAVAERFPGDAGPRFVEADIVDGVRAVGLEAFEGLHCRVCRPLGLMPDEIEAVTRYAVEHVRHHSLFVPRDFDVSPYFEVVKPTVAAGFDRRLNWGDGPKGGLAAGADPE